MSHPLIEAAAGHLFFAPGSRMEDVPLSRVMGGGEKPGNSIGGGRNGVRQGSNSLALAINPVVDLSSHNDSDRT